MKPSCPSPARGVDRAGDAGVRARQEADEDDRERGGVELFRAVVLGERAALGVVALLAHLVVDFLADQSPPVERRVQPDRSASATARSNTTHAITLDWV
jgi:hypothetical protein